ncbi:hypothetical protein ACIPEN_00650 [Herbaspirillum chlorophenolicum]|uniref:Transmembrane protein n=1 Tax=Herbaspirillum chlorophenolicum TaxID=211589 RepID=A0ABW8EW61_9BURK
MKPYAKLCALTPDRAILAALLLLFLVHLWPAYSAWKLRRESAMTYAFARPLMGIVEAGYRNGTATLAGGSDPRNGVITLQIAGQPEEQSTLTLIPMIRSPEGFHPLDLDIAQSAGKAEVIIWFCVSPISKFESSYLMNKPGSLPGRYAPFECRRQRMEEKIGGVSWLKK